VIKLQKDLNGLKAISALHLNNLATCLFLGTAAWSLCFELKHNYTTTYAEPGITYTEEKILLTKNSKHLATLDM
jgi:hypothetical protein